MIFDTTTFLYVLLFLGTLLFVEGIFYLVAGLRDGPEKRVNRRLKLAAGNTNPRAVLRKMRREDQGRHPADPSPRLLAQGRVQLVRTASSRLSAFCGSSSPSAVQRTRPVRSTSIA